MFCRMTNGGGTRVLACRHSVHLGKTSHSRIVPYEDNVPPSLEGMRRHGCCGIVRRTVLLGRPFRVLLLYGRKKNIKRIPMTFNGNRTGSVPADEKPLAFLGGAVVGAS